jgi:hypothetical protein
MANGLVVHKDHTCLNHKGCVARHRAAVIPAHAQMHGLTIICTYRNDGESGLKIGRAEGCGEIERSF